MSLDGPSLNYSKGHIRAHGNENMKIAKSFNLLHKASKGLSFIHHIPCVSNIFVGMKLTFLRGISKWIEILLV
jgi:hypothetical protein